MSWESGFCTLAAQGQFGHESEWSGPWRPAGNFLAMEGRMVYMTIQLVMNPSVGGKS